MENNVALQAVTNCNAFWNDG